MMIITPHIVAMVTCADVTLVSMVTCVNETPVSMVTCADGYVSTLTTLPCLSPNTWRNQIGGD